MRRDIFQAIADPTRRAIITLIAVQAMTPNVEEEAQPRAFAASLDADAVHAVVPVARADERQPVRAARDPLVDCPLHSLATSRNGILAFPIISFKIFSSSASS